MAKHGNLGDTPAGGDEVARLSRTGDRTSLMIIDAVIGAVPQEGESPLAAALEARALARRMLEATRDFHATMEMGRNAAR